MVYANAEAFLNHQFPAVYQAHLPHAFRNAYAAVREFSRQEPIFQVETAHQNLGHVRNLAIDWVVERLISTRTLPFEYDYTDFGKPSGKWLRIKLPHATMSISQVRHPNKIPRKALFRANNTLNNMPFLGFNEFAEEERVRGLPHLLITHGHQELKFIHIGIPYPQGMNQNGYIHQTTNLLTRPSVVKSDLPPVEGLDAEAVVELTEELKKWWRDNGAG